MLYPSILAAAKSGFTGIGGCQFFVFAEGFGLMMSSQPPLIAGEHDIRHQKYKSDQIESRLLNRLSFVSEHFQMREKAAL